MPDIFDQAEKQGDIFDQAAVRPDYEKEAFAHPPVAPTKKVKYGALSGALAGVGESENLATQGNAEIGREYGRRSFGEIVGGAKDIAHGDVSRGIHRAISGAGTALAPAAMNALPFAAATAPAATGMSLAGAFGGQQIGKRGGEMIGLSPDQSDVAGDVLGAAGGLLGAKVPGAFPSRARAGANFGRASQGAGDFEVNVAKAGDAALKAKDLADAGATLPKVINRFLVRATDPKAEPLTYDEARLFYKNAGQLSANESMNNKPEMKMLLNQFRTSLGKSIGETAESAGVGDEYQSAMSEYRNASRVRDVAKNAGKAALKYLPYGFAAYEADKIFGRGR